MTKEEQIKYFKEKYGIENVYEVKAEKDNTTLVREDLVYDGLNDMDGNINTEPFSPKPHTAILISGKKPQGQ